MSLLVESLKHEDSEAELSVIRKTKGETYEPNKIIHFGINSIGSYTPDEIINLGNWLVENGNSIKKRYDKDGKKI